MVLFPFSLMIYTQETVTVLFVFLLFPVPLVLITKHLLDQIIGNLGKLKISEIDDL